MKINCDIGERGPDHPVDLRLMEIVHIANIACGGHAGDSHSAAAFLALARQRGVEVMAHLSYPDRTGFGRRHVQIERAELLAALDAQQRLLPGVQGVKLHGALYNESAADAKLAAALADWMKERHVTTILAPPGSEIAGQAAALGLDVLYEAFAERRYEIAGGRLRLAPRSRPHAVIADLDEAVSQGLAIARRGRVQVWREDGTDAGEAELRADTLCVHSDSPIALDLARRLRVALDR